MAVKPRRGASPLRWRRVDDAAAIAVVIPSARNPQQARVNVAAADLPPLPDEVVDAIARMYAASRVQKIYGGANEVLKDLVSRKL